MIIENHYGKSRVRLIKVERAGARHSLRDLSIDIQLSGDFEPAYRDGDNSKVLPTDTMKNTVYAFARRQPLGEIEEFGQRLAAHFLARNPPAEQVRIAITQRIWKRIMQDNQPHDHAFLKAGEESRVAVIDASRDYVTVQAGIADLVVLKTSRSGFEGFLRDEFTTLKETSDRLFGTAIQAEWTYGPGPLKYGALWKDVRETVLDVFASHDSRGVQHTLNAIGEAVLERFPEIVEIRLTMPNRHCLLVDLSPFGLDNPNEVFVPIDEPHGLIAATLRRG